MSRPKKNLDSSHWSNGRVAALIVGNDEILSPTCRWGKGGIDPSTTLTYLNGETCSLIDMLKRHHLDASKRHPELNISYEEAVNGNANIFLSFAYDDNYMELVDALEKLSIDDPKNFHRDSTY